MKDDPPAFNESANVARPTIGAQLWWGLPALAALLVAGALRYLVIEPAAIAHACDPAPWTGWCALRSGLVRTFSTQGLGWLALAAGIAAVATRRRVATAAMPAASASQPSPWVEKVRTSPERSAHQPVHGAGSQACAIAAGSMTR